MNNEPDIIINIGGNHPAKGIVAVIIGSALEEAKAKSVNHIEYDQETFVEMKRAIHESAENNLSTANVLIVEWDEEEQMQFEPEHSAENPVSE